MAPRKQRTASAGPCQHTQLTLTSSPAAAAAGYIPYSQQQLFTAATGKREHVARSDNVVSTADYPAPLALPGDAIVDDPRYPTQSLRSWLNLSARNEITSRRNVVYVAAPPDFGPGAEIMEEYSHAHGVKSSIHGPRTRTPEVDGVISYLKSFYYGVNVKRLPVNLTWVPWDDPDTKTRPPVETFVGLKTNEEIIRIRLRDTAAVSEDGEDDQSARTLFSHQVNQLDLLDVAQAVLPADGYTVLLVVDHDMFEDADDDFCCGRAYGGSRIAVVSTARYNPDLDEVQGVDRVHAWPASHCNAYAEKTRLAEFGSSRSAKRRKVNAKSIASSKPDRVAAPAAELGALHAAVQAHLDLLRDDRTGNSNTNIDLPTTYLLRVSRTASHEIGHCFGMDHCMYYACVMQGTCTLLEDNRQPPYLCPVCEAKVCHAIQTRSKSDIEDSSRTVWKRARHEALLRFCARVGKAFAPLRAWEEMILLAPKGV